MKCKNCNKEIENNIYCPYCGELIKENELGSDNHVNLNEDLGENFVENIKKYKRILGTLGAIVLVIIVGFGVFNFIKGGAVSENKVKELVVGQYVGIYGNEYKITKDNLESFKIKSRDTERKNSDIITADIVLNLDSMKVEAEGYISLIYYNNKGWEFNNLSLDNLEVTPNENIDEKLEELLLDESFSLGSSYFTIEEEDSIEDIEVKDGKDNLEKDFTCNIVTSNGFLKAIIPLEGVATFENGEWHISDLTSTAKSISSVTELEENPEEGLKDHIENLLEDKNLSFTFVKGEEKETLNVSSDLLDDLKIDSYEEVTSNIVVQISGTINSGAITNATFKGELTIAKGFNDSYVKYNSLEVSEFELKELDESTIKELLIGKTVDGKTVTESRANTFKITSSEKNGLFSARIKGTINMGDGEKEISITTRLSENSDGELNWN